MNDKDEIKAEYDFSRPDAVRGKHARAYRQGHSVSVHHADGSSTTQHFTLAEGAVLLAPDVAREFPDSESVNEALRLLIHLAKDRVRKAG